MKELIKMIPVNRKVKHLFIINPKSFWHKRNYDRVVAEIHGFFKLTENNNYDIRVSRFPRDAACFIPLYAENLDKETTLRVYAVGGDGILFDCLNGVMGLENVELAALPYGRTNDFIRGFGGNGKSLFRSVSRQYNAPVVHLDVIRCGDRYALNYCSVGLEAETIRHTGKIRERMEKGNTLSQWLCRRLYVLLYFVGGFLALRGQKKLRRRYEMTVDGEYAEGFNQVFSVFNSLVYGGIRIPVNNASSYDGIPDIIIIRSKGFLRTYAKLFSYMTGRYEMFPGSFIFKRGRKINIRSDNPHVLSMDGEVFYESDLTVELLPSAVKFADAGMRDNIGGNNDRNR